MIKSIIKNVCEVAIKFSKQGYPLDKLPRDIYLRKEKYKSWKESGIIPSMEIS